MQDYLADNWSALLANNGLQSFDDWWQRDAEWFEEPNYRRGGWSGVSQLELTAPDGSTRAVFLKRQENHVCKTLRHPIKGVPTFIREMRNILRLKNAGVAALVPVYFAVRTIEGAQRAVLVTESLEGFSPLDEIVVNALEHNARHQLIKAVADLLRRLHAQRLQHNCLYPKHVFVKRLPAGFEVRLIDLEKTKQRLCRRIAMLRDLDTLNRHSHGWSRTDRMRFLSTYLENGGYKADVKQLWQQLAKLAAKKAQRHRQRQN